MGILDLFKAAAGAPAIERLRHEPRRRQLRVERTERVTPGMLRLTFVGTDLANFRSLGFDDHLKIYAPETSERRDYTVRRYDSEAATLVIDFALHQGGAITDWAEGAKSGDAVEISGPKGSAVVSRAVRRWLLIGDESALPAIGRCVEEAEPGTEIVTLVSVAGADEQQLWETRAILRPLWAHRPLSDAADPESLLARLRNMDLVPDTYIWVAAEARVARAVRDYLVGERCYPRSWIKAGGYWVKGRAGGKERLG